MLAFPPSLPSHYESDRKAAIDKQKQESLAKEIDLCSRVSLVKGVSSHLKCPGCGKLIQDPRILACSHTYCKSCLDKAVRKTVDVGAPNITPRSAGGSGGGGSGTSLEPFFLDYNLRRILGSSLNKELETSLSKILDPNFLSIGNLEAKTDPKVVEKSASAKPSSSKPHKKKTSGKSKGGKSQESVPTASQNSSAAKTVSPAAQKGGVADTSSRTKAETGAGKTSGGKAPTMEVLVCPECGMHTEIPGGNISLIPYNFFMQHIMDLMAYYSSGEPVPLVHCSMCRKDGVSELPAAVARCSTCASFLCKQCYELHSIDDFTKLHSTLSITERGDSSIFSCLTPDDTKVRNCKTHHGKPFTYYCIKCSKGICEICARGEHETHLFSQPDNLRESYVQYIHDLMSRTTQLRRRTESSVRTTQDLMSGIQLLAATQIEEVLRTQGVLSSALETRLSVLMREADALSAQGSGKRSGKRS